jgi:hypothetical protein
MSPTKRTPQDTASSYIVTSRLVIVRTTTGNLVHVYEGQPLPATSDPDDLARLARDGAITKLVGHGQ